MRKLFTPIVVATLCVSALVAAEAPPVSITVKSYDALEAGARTLINAVAPGEADAVLAEFREEIGVGEMAGIDKSKPWQAVIWLESASREPSVSIRIPVTDYDAFKEGFDISELTGSGDAGGKQHDISRAGNYAVVWIEAEGTSASVKSANADWNPDALQSVDHLLRVAFRPAEPLRNELLGFLGMGRMMITGALSEQPEEVVPGIDMGALRQVMGLYFDVVEKGIRGVGELSAGLNVDGDAIILDEAIIPKAGTELADWLKGGGESLEGVLPYLDKNAPGAFAMRFGNSEAIKPLLKKYLGLSFQLMGAESDDPIIADTEKLIDDMLPVQIGGFLDFDKQMKFGGAYRFPGKDLEATYSQFKRYITESMTTQVGEDKPYKDISFEEGVRDIAGEQIDQVSMMINLDAPIYQQPGQKDMLNLIWGGETIRFDYATKGDEMFVGTGGTIDALLQNNVQASVPTLDLGANTVVYGRLNLLELIPNMLSGHPMMPPEMKERIAEIDTAGTDVSLRLNLDSGLHSRTKVPVKLISTVVKFVGEQGGK